MSSLGSIWYQLGIKDMTDADLQKINKKLENLGANIKITPEFAKSITDVLPKGITLELDPKLKSVTNEMLEAAVKDKVMRVQVMPLLTHLRKALKDATKDNPPEMEVGVQSTKLRMLIERVLNKHGFMINISTVNDNYTKVVQQKLNGTRYTVKIHADAKEITRSVQASLMQVQSRYFGLKISRDILYRSIDEALGGRKFPISVYVKTDDVRNAVQTALNKASGMNPQNMKAAVTELNRVQAAQLGAADAANTHSEAAKGVGSSLFSLSGPIGEVKSMLADLWSIHAAKEFLSQVIEIGGELEHQKIAMDTIFGDKGKTVELFGQIKGLARQSPFGVMELTKSVKALSAYGVQYNEIYDTAKRLADISAATSVDINRLILAFGKTKSRGFLDGLEAKQFAYANIPIYEMVRKKLEELEGQAVTTQQVMERMKKREIGFDIVKDVLWDMTDPGGKFYNMQEALAGSVKTSWKLVRDNIELMFGEIAEGSIGSGLKSIAEMLQGLTRNWRTLGSVIAAGAVAFGAYRVAVALSNRMMGEANALGVRKALTSNKVAAANALEAESYRQLTHAENYAILAKSGLQKLNRSLLLSHKALTQAEWDGVIASKAVNSDYIARRIALSRITAAELRYLLSIKAVEVADVRAALASRHLTVSLASLWAMMKQTKVGQWFSSLGTSMKGISLSGIWKGFLSSVQRVPGRFKALTNQLTTTWTTFTQKVRAFTWSGFVTGAKNGFKSVTQSIIHAEVGVTRLKLAFASLGRAASSIGAFLLNPVTIAMAAIGGLMYAWEKNNEQMEKAKEIGENIFTKASEGANNLRQILKDIKPSEGLSTHELTQGIEQMEQAIKDYSPRPLQDINDTLVTQDGHVLTLVERYDALKKKVEGVKAAYDVMGDADKKDVGTIVSDAIKSTGSLLNDTVMENAKDYTESLKRRSDAIRDVIKNGARGVKQAVDAAIEADGAFAKVAKGMKNTAAMFNELASNPEKYSLEHSLPNVRSVILAADIPNDNRRIDEDKAKFESDVQAFIEDMTANIRITWDKEIKDLDEGQKNALAISLKNMLEQADGVSEEVKMQWAKILEKAFGIDLGLKVDGVSLIKDEFAANMEKGLGKELADKIRRGVELTPEERKKARHALYLSYKSVFDRSDEDARRALNDAMQGKGAQSQTYELITRQLNRNANASGWQKQIIEAIGDIDLDAIDVKITGHSDLNSFIDEARKGYKAANEAIKELKPILIKAGIEFIDGEEISAVPLSLKGDAVALEAINNYNAKVRATKALKEALKAQGIDLDVDPNKRQAAEKDDFAKSLKQRFKDIKDAWSEFQKWSKTEGRDAAATRIGKSGLFSTLSADQIPKTIEDYRALVEGLEDELRKAGVKGTARESLLNELVKQLLNIDKTIVDEQLKLALDTVTKEAERQLADWNLFEKIRKATGNQNLAMSIAFGMNATAETDYPTMIKEQFKKASDAAENALSKAKPKKGETPYEVQGYNYEKLKKLYDDRSTDKGMQAWMAVPEKIRSEWEKANGDIIKYFNQQKESIVDILNEYQSLQDKLTKIDSDREDKIKTVQESDLSDTDKAKYIQRINVEADYQKFTQSNEYLQFFSGVYSLTMEKAQQIGDKIRQHLDQRLQAGKLSAEEYYKEIERINQQLTKLRNVKSDAMTFMTSGIKGVQNKKLEKADSDILAQMAEVKDAEEKLQEAKAKGNEEAIKAAEEQLNLANQSVKSFTKIRDAIIKDKEKWQNVADVANIAANIAGGISDAFNTIKDMAAAFGADTDSGAWASIGAVIDTMTTVTSGVQKVVQSAMSGDIGGIISGTVDTLLTPFTIWSKLHDAELQKQIELSEKEYEARQRLIDVIDREIDRYLGHPADYRSNEDAKAQAKELREQRALELDRKNIDEKYTQDLNEQIAKLDKLSQSGEGGAYAYKKIQMEGQLAELERQRRLELEKKDVDDDKVKELDAQIAELRDQIRYFAEDMAKELYDIDLKSWAKDLGNEIFNAWKKGEDGAEAFKKKVADIMGDVMNNILRLEILEPMMKDIRTMLFGSDGNGGMMGKDYKLDESDVKKIADKLMKGSEQVEAYNRVMDEVDDYMKRNYGVSMKDTDSKSGLSAGIQGITENTADLLASYVNAIRAEVSMSRQNWDRLLDAALPQMNIIAESQLRVQQQIAENTSRNAAAAEAIAKSNDEINRLLARVTQGGAVFYVK